jgi:hypothetical protein
MTLYSSDPRELMDTARQVLAERVLPAVVDEAARADLHAVLELLDNLVPRLDFRADQLAAVLQRTDHLADALGVPRGGVVTVEELRAHRASLAAALATVYTNGGGADLDVVVAAVHAATEADVRDQISVALRPGLPD